MTFTSRNQNSDRRNTEAELLSKEGRFVSDGSLGEIARIHDALPADKKRLRVRAVSGQSLQHQQA